LKDKACEELDNRGHEDSEEGGDDRVSDTEEKRLREEATYEKIMVKKMLTCDCDLCILVNWQYVACLS
jgi:hypothetical protein